MWLDFRKPNIMSHLTNCSLLSWLIVTLVHYPCTVSLPAWSAFVESEVCQPYQVTSKTMVPVRAPIEYYGRGIASTASWMSHSSYGVVLALVITLWHHMHSKLSIRSSLLTFYPHSYHPNAPPHYDVLKLVHASINWLKTLKI